MSRICDLTGKGYMNGHNVSNSNVKTKRKFYPNLKLKKFYIPEEDKWITLKVILECTEHKTSGMPGMSRYITTKNKKNTTERLELKKFNPVLRKVTVHKEIK
ncbi:hypothetical protein Lal_00049074 [Lupinus albus]|nr:hypothetical protein Lal_00049074 [Lupinus albus]